MLFVRHSKVQLPLACQSYSAYGYLAVWLQDLLECLQQLLPCLLLAGSSCCTRWC